MILWNLVTLFSLAADASPVALVQPSGEESQALALRQVTVDKCSPSSPDGIQPECWQVLEVNNHLNDWWSKNSERCKKANKGFSQCYLDTAGLITWSCDFISLNGCTPPPSGQDDEYASYQEFYSACTETSSSLRTQTLTTVPILAINLFWTNYHQALMQGQATAIGAVAEIVKVVAPPKTKNAKTPLFAPIWAITTGQLAMLFPPLGAYVYTSMALASVLGVLGGGAGLVNLLFPPKQVNPVPWEGLSAALSEHVNEYQKNVGVALTAIQTDFDKFYAMTSNGGFSQKFRTNLPENTDFMYHNLLKWTLNEALEGMEYFVVKNPGVDPRKIPIDPYDCTNLDQFNTCGPIWYDGRDSYGLARANDIGMDRMKEILDVAFAKNWTTPQELYIDSQSCRGRNGSEAFDVKDLTLSCVSNLPVCEFNFDFNPFEVMDTRYNPPQFTNCPNMRGYGTPGLWSNEAGVPLTYLGPFLMVDVIYNEKQG
ncbi:hypothetical protein CH63R_06119 [Colletotrichum higginsianum IMI 349063]|uniref:Uncharacterized protein n=1 Tax=Colletotrichum higginsianum (strain IMI 349063) TaxID=759273 RepID=A0A1B7YEB4_COLHI|nr:hypothetical protein CH63R_06119 [Colletotrichum higginsianum IMI 349063]OBR10427.1 hypothetical protein CH63R_06119 [Colletotrichum higginsianum IMI 349063]